MSAQNTTNSSIFTLDIEGMTCASCVGRVEKALDKIPGVEAASVNLATEQAKVRLKSDSETSVAEVIAQVQKTGYGAKLSNPHGGSQSNLSHAFWHSLGPFTQMANHACHTSAIYFGMALL